MNIKHTKENATLAGGCFWCLEAIFMNLKGVEEVEPGYSGGYVESPSYEEVCSGETGHAEVIQVSFNPKVISYEQLLEVFFSIHDPSTKDRQGADVGTQYRSAIFYHNEDQKVSIEQFIGKLKQNQVFAWPIVTEVKEFTHFYPAEEYHYEYYKKNPRAAYCAMVITPKIKKFFKEYSGITK